jgi:filamentous hemagglutinin
MGHRPGGPARSILNVAETVGQGGVAAVAGIHPLPARNGGAAGTVASELSSLRVESADDVLELGGGPNGSKIPGARNVDPRDPNAIGADMRNMPNVAANSQRQVVVSNPYLDGVEASSRNMMSYLPETARVTRPGGEIIVSGNQANPFFNRLPTAAELNALGLEISYQGPLLPSLRGQSFSRTTGGNIPPDTMQTIVFVKK